MDSLYYLLKRIDTLQFKIDSFNNVVTLKEMNFRLNDQNNIVSQVNSFYDSAWLKLLFVITILGIIIPVLANYYQKKGFKDLTDFILNQIKDTYDNKIQELKIYNDTQIQGITSKYISELENLKIENQALVLEMDASIIYLQGKTLLLSKDYHSAFIDFMKSTEKYLLSKKPERAKVTITNALIAVKKFTTKADILKIDRIRNFNYSNSVASIKDNENYEIVHEKMDAIDDYISKLA